MDVARPDRSRQKRLGRILYTAGALLAVTVIALGLSRLRPAAPTVDRGTVWMDTVKRGSMVRNVRGLGTLVPEDIRWISATTEGRVENIFLRPGTVVQPDSVILELSNPELDQEVEDARLEVQAAEAALANLRVLVHDDYLQQKAAAASLQADYAKAKMTLETTQALAARQLAPAFDVKRAQLDVDQLAVRNQIAQDQLTSQAQSGPARLAVQQSAVDQARAVLHLKRRQREALHVRAGLAGVLQIVAVDVGQQVAPGANLARVANPARLKAQIKIAESRAKDIQIGQRADIDTRNGIIEGRVTRLDPSVQDGTRTVDVALLGALPKGAVPDLSVDGTIELERLADVLYVARPAFGQEDSVVGIFRLLRDGSTAERVQVTLGLGSVNEVEIRSGLSVGDHVILSDTSAWDTFDRVRLR